MVEMHDWDTFLKEKKVTLAGMKDSFPAQGFRAHDVRLTPDPEGRVEWNKPLHGLSEGGDSKRYTRVPIASTMQRLQDYHRMHQMWRRQQEALQRRIASGEHIIPGKIAGKENQRAVDYLWKPGMPFQIHTPEKSYATPNLMSSLRPGVLGMLPLQQGRAGVQEGGAGHPKFLGWRGGVAGWMNRLLGLIPGLRDTSAREQVRAKVETNRLGMAALNRFYRLKSKYPLHQMSDDDRKLVTQMMYGYFTESAGLEPLAARMVANAVPKLDDEHMDAIHQGIADHIGEQSTTNVGGALPHSISQQEMATLVQEASESVARVRRKRRKNKKSEFEAESMPEMDWSRMPPEGGEAAPEERDSNVIEYVLEPDEFKAMWGSTEPVSSASLDDPTSTRSGWEANDRAMHYISAGLQRMKQVLHRNEPTHKLHLHNLQLPKWSLEGLLLHPESAMQQHLADAKRGDPSQAMRAQQVLQHLVAGWHEGDAGHHKTIDNMVGFLAGSPEYLAATVKAHPAEYPHYIEGRPSSILESPPPDINTEYRYSPEEAYSVDEDDEEPDMGV
jgi:hypothetical protein